MHINNSHKPLTVTIIVVIVLFVLGGGAMFYWYNLAIPPPTDQTDNSKVEEFDNTPTIEPSYSSEAENPNSDVRNPEKSPEQYDGQNEAGDTSNANCPDGDCSNFAIPKGEN
jgi:flagellar basal body-associated protein FliL